MKWREDKEAWERVLQYSLYGIDSKFTDDEEDDLRNLRKVFFHKGKAQSNYKIIRKKVVEEIVQHNKALLCECMEKLQFKRECKFSEFLGVTNSVLRGWKRNLVPRVESADKVFESCGVRLLTQEDAHLEIYKRMDKENKKKPIPAGQLLKEVREEMLAYNREVLERYMTEHELCVSEVARRVESKGRRFYCWFTTSLPKREQTEKVLKNIGIKLYSLEDSREQAKKREELQNHG